MSKWLDADREGNSGSFHSFQQLCYEIGNEGSYNSKTQIISDYVKTFKGDLYILCNFLICKHDSRIFNVGDKVIVKTLSKVLELDKDEMLIDLEKGDVSETSKRFFKRSKYGNQQSQLSLKQIDSWLDILGTLTKENDIYNHFNDIVPYLSPEDIKWLCKLIDKDLKINIGAKFVLNALHPKGFEVYNKSSNLKTVIDDIINKRNDFSDSIVSIPKSAGEDSMVMNPIRPMLAKPVKSFDELFQKLTNGMIAEIKYDGERVQIHKSTKNEYNFFSRNLKPVKENKVEGLDKVLSQSVSAEEVHSYILDGEVLVVDKVTKQMLPFGSLGVHKQKQYPNAQLCYFIFDLLMINGISTMEKPYLERRNMIFKYFKEIESKIQYSEYYDINTREDLDIPWQKVLNENLEGLVVKDKFGTYKPNQRHWIKLKKDYLEGMVDTLDLVVLGAYWGKGMKGGKLSSFLLGCYDEEIDKFKTVCKSYSGIDEKTLDKLQNAFDLEKIDCDPLKVPPWLLCSKSLVPNFVVKDPKKSQVWEILGTSFSVSPNHTANGLSVRFPRFVGFRDDKDWKTATSLKELEEMALKQPDIKQIREASEKFMDKSISKPKANISNEKQEYNEKIQSTIMRNVYDKTKKSESRIYSTKNGLKYVRGSITEPVHTKKDGRLIIFLVDDSDQWPESDEFFLTSEAWPNVKENFDKKIEEVEMGSVMICSIQEEGIKGKSYVAFMKLISSYDLTIDDDISSSESLIFSFIEERKINSIHYSMENMCTSSSIPVGVLNMLKKLSHMKHEVFIYNLHYIKESPTILLIDDDEEVKTKPKEMKSKTNSKRSLQSTDIFEGMSFLLYNCVSEDNNVLKSFIYADGGKSYEYSSSNLVTKFTHILTESDSYDSILESLKAQNPSSIIIKPKWLWDSIDKGYPIDDIKEYSLE